MKKRKYTSLVGIALVLIFCCLVVPGLSRTGTGKPGSPEPGELTEGIAGLMEKASIPGLSAALIREGKLVWQRGFGVKSMKTAGPVTGRTVFEAASLSKAVFAYGVLKLVEKGVLDLDKSLSSYLPRSYIEDKFSKTILKDDRLKKITARMVLSHTCGFPNWRRKELEILFTPGEKFSYSGEGFVYLQRVVEYLTGVKMEDYMQREVLTPLGMKDSSYVWRDSYDRQAARAHKFVDDSGPRKSTRGNAAASLMTTAPDYARFILAIMNDRGLQPATIRQMLSPQVKLEKGKGLYWGLGVGLIESPRGRAYWHWGDNGDFKAFFIAYKKERSGLVYFANSSLGLSIGEDLASLVLGGDYGPVFREFLDYPRHDSPFVRAVQTYLHSGIDALLEDIRAMHKNPDKMGYVTRERLTGLGRALQMDPDAAIKIMTLNRELHPRSFKATRDLGRAYLEKGDKKKAVLLFKQALDLDEKKKEDTRFIDWCLGYVKALEQRTPLPAAYLEKLTGDYGERHVIFKEGKLYYFRDNRDYKEPKELISLSRDTFVIEDFYFFRLKFDLDTKGEPQRLLGLYEDGRTDQSPRIR